MRIVVSGSNTLSIMHYVDATWNLNYIRGY